MYTLADPSKSGRRDASCHSLRCCVWWWPIITSKLRSKVSERCGRIGEPNDRKSASVVHDGESPATQFTEASRPSFFLLVDDAAPEQQQAPRSVRSRDP